jgi:hypothetical protein
MAPGERSKRAENDGRRVGGFHWEARETWKIRSHDEFVETFELAEPGNELQVYSRNSFNRAR